MGRDKDDRLSGVLLTPLFRQLPPVRFTPSFSQRPTAKTGPIAVYPLLGTQSIRATIPSSTPLRKFDEPANS